MMAIKIYVPSDTTALSMGADDVARRIEHHAGVQGVAIELVRNGSRGLFWLEPMVEVETASGRIGYGPVEPDDVHELVEAGLFDGASGHPLFLGPVVDIIIMQPLIQHLHDVDTSFDLLLAMALCAFARDQRLEVGERFGGGGIGVNSFLWRASLDTISFMPLSSADPFGGVIITDWFAPPETGGQERFKLTVFILDQTLRADAAGLARTELNGLMLKSVLALAEAIEDPSPGIRLRAIQITLAMGFKANDLHDMARRFERVDEALHLWTSRHTNW